MNKFLVGLLLSTTSFATSLEVSYSAKDILFLKQSKSSFKELKGTRVRRPTLNVVITNDAGKKEKFQVKLEKEELRKIDTYLNVQKSGKSLAVSYGAKKLKVKKGADKKLKLSTKSANKLITRNLKKDIAHLMKGIDQNIDLNRMQLSISRSSLTCSSLKAKDVTCLMQTRAKAIIKAQDKGPINRLAIHLNDLKGEMKKSKGLDYDIDGYREFLNKSERLITLALDSDKSVDIEKLVNLKQMIIDERIDSYEYSAIRAKSVLGFVQKVITKLNS